MSKREVVKRSVELMSILKSKNSKMSGWPPVIIINSRENGVKTTKVVTTPTLKFRATIPELAHRPWSPIVKLDETEEYETEYSNLYHGIASISDIHEGEGATARDTEFVNSCYDGKMRTALKRLHLYPWLHGTDVDLTDHYYTRFIDENSEDLSVTPKIRKGYWDIESDGRLHRKIHNPEVANCPTNAVSLFDSSTKILYGFFSREMVEHCQSMIDFENSDIELFKNNMIEEIRAESVNKNIKFEEFTIDIKFFDTELEMYKAFFNCAHYVCDLDVLLAWNQSYDIVSTITRLANYNGVNPIDIMCHSSIAPKFREVSYKEDTFSKKIVTKRDRWNITTSFIFSDQLVNYCRIRASQPRKESYKLGDILDNEIGVTKTEFSCSISDLPYKDYPTFAKYSLTDSYRLYQLDKKTGDTDSLYDLSLFTRTRFEKAMSKTTCLRNLANWMGVTEGRCVSNNRNALNSNYEATKAKPDDADKEEKTGFRGAFVADLNLIDNVGSVLFGKKSSKLFELVCDDDFKALYPSIIISFNIDSNTQIGRIEFADDPGLNDEGIDQTVKFVDIFTGGDMIDVGSEYLELPSYDELDAVANQIINGTFV